MLDSLNRFFAAWLATFRAMFSPIIFGSFLMLAAAQGLVLWLLVIAPSTTLGGWPIELLRAWFGPAAGHYPSHLVLLPYMFFRSSIVVYGLVGIVLYAMATGGFARKFTGTWDGPRGVTATAFGRYIPLFVLWVVYSSVVIFGISNLPGLFESWTFGSPRREIFIDIFTRVVVVAFLSLWAYTTFLLIVDRTSLLRAVRESMRQFFRRPLATFFLVGVPYAITVPFSLIAAKSDYLAGKFRPETIIYVLILVIFVQFWANLITCGSITHYYLGEPTRE